MTIKKGSLTFPSDPLAAMQELAALDAPTPPITEKDILTSRQQDILTDSNPDRQMDRLQERKPESQKASRKNGAVEKTSELKDTSKIDPSEIDPLDLALLQKLSRPYPDLGKEKSTLVSTRLPDDLVERLGLAADLVKKHKKNKQDVIARGLILAFQELVDADGSVEWYE